MDPSVLTEPEPEPEPEPHASFQRIEDIEEGTAEGWKDLFERETERLLECHNEIDMMKKLMSEEAMVRYRVIKMQASREFEESGSLKLRLDKLRKEAVWPVQAAKVRVAKLKADEAEKLAEEAVTQYTDGEIGSEAVREAQANATELRTKAGWQEKDLESRPSVPEGSTHVTIIDPVANTTETSLPAAADTSMAGGSKRRKSKRRKSKRRKSKKRKSKRRKSKRRCC